MGKLILTESEKTKIRQLHGLNGIDLINEQMDAEIKKIKCRKKYGEKSEKLTKNGWTKAEEGEEHKEGYKTKTIPNRQCKDELWVKAKKGGNMYSRWKDKRTDDDASDSDAAELNNLNSDVIGKIVGTAIGTVPTKGVVNMIGSENWIIKVDGGEDTNYVETALNAIKGMLQLGATVETLNYWMMSNTEDCYKREVNTDSVHDVVNDKYILSSPRKALISLDRITRGLTIRNKEIRELKKIVKTFKNDATNFWNAVENGLGGNDEVITKQFATAKIRDIKDLFRKFMTEIARTSYNIVELVAKEILQTEKTEMVKGTKVITITHYGACSYAKTEKSAKDSEQYK